MCFKLPRITKCCCCVPLRIGSLIIGYFSIISSLITMAMMSYAIYSVATYVDKTHNQTNSTHTTESQAQIAMGLYFTFAYYIILFAYNAVVSGLLVYGVHTNKTKFLKIFVKYTEILFYLSIALIVLTFVFMGFFITAGMLQWSMTLWFIIIIVRSTYLEMEDNEKVAATEMQLYGPRGVQAAPLMA